MSEFEPVLNPLATFTSRYLLSCLRRTNKRGAVSLSPDPLAGNFDTVFLIAVKQPSTLPGLVALALRGYPFSRMTVRIRVISTRG